MKRLTSLTAKEIPMPKSEVTVTGDLSVSIKFSHSKEYTVGQAQKLQKKFEAAVKKALRDVCVNEILCSALSDAAAYEVDIDDVKCRVDSK